jgi:hypothetical protein
MFDIILLLLIRWILIIIVLTLLLVCIYVDCLLFLGHRLFYGGGCVVLDFICVVIYFIYLWYFKIYCDFILLIFIV